MTVDGFRIELFSPGGALSLYRDEIWSILEQSDKDFVPPLSEREPVTLGPVKQAKGSWAVPIQYLDYTMSMHVLIAWSETTVVGFLSFDPNFTHETIPQFPSCVRIDMFAVAPAWRRKGLERSLYKSFFRAEEVQKYKDVVLHSWSTNKLHNDLIESIGFTELSRIVDDRAPGIDTVVYHRATKPDPFTMP